MLEIGICAVLVIVSALDTAGVWLSLMVQQIGKRKVIVIGRNRCSSVDSTPTLQLIVTLLVVVDISKVSACTDCSRDFLVIN